MRKVSLLILLVAMLLMPTWVFSAEVVGTIQGYTCVTTGKICPVDKEDPLVAATRVFVVKLEGPDYYFIPNLDRALLARYLNKRVRVVGEINPRYRSIRAKEFQVWRNGRWNTVWTKELEEQIKKEFEVGT